MTSCKECGGKLWDGENCFGKPFEYYVCDPCFDDMSKKKRDAYIKDGVVPCTRGILTDEWRKYCAKFGMQP